MKQKTKDVFGALSSATESAFNNGFESGFGFDEPAKNCKTEVPNSKLLGFKMALYF